MLPNWPPTEAGHRGAGQLRKICKQAAPLHSVKDRATPRIPRAPLTEESPRAGESGEKNETASVIRQGHARPEKPNGVTAPVRLQAKDIPTPRIPRNRGTWRRKPI